MKKLLSLLFLLLIAFISVCQDFVGQHKDQINRKVEKITKQPDVLRYQTAELGYLKVEVYNPKENEEGGSIPTKELIPADTMSFVLGKNSEIKIDCYFLTEKINCDSVVIHCYNDVEGQGLINHLINDSFRKWKDMGNNEYLSMQYLGGGSRTGFGKFILAAKMKIEYPEEENVYSRITIVKAEIAEKEWKKLQKQKRD